MFKRIIDLLTSGSRTANPPVVAGGSRVFIVRQRGGAMDAMELFGDPSGWDRVAIAQWASDSEQLFGFTGDPDGDGIEDWKGQGWACGFLAADSGDAVNRARTGQFEPLAAWFP